ncbi:MAG: sulfatase-like hydrolase/transferase [Chitinophagales bacterium]
MITSDHGNTLGQKGHFGKGTLWQPDVRVPLLISSPKTKTAHSCYNPVSLLDLFPTFCDIVQKEVPKFKNGKPYLDGYSLWRFVEDSTLLIEKPITSIANKDNFAVINQRFHYIKYKPADAAGKMYEHELYEIGKHRDMDIYQWNNLADNTEYQNVIDYLSQWLPDSSLYLNPYYRLQVTPTTPQLPCIYTQSDSIMLDFKMFDTEGKMLENIPPHFKISWTNNLTKEISHDKNYRFKLSKIDSSIWQAQKDIIFYLRLTDTTRQTFAFDMIKFNLNNKPSISFDIEKKQTEVVIKEYTTTGNFDSNKLLWNWGNGYTSIQDRVPAPYAYVLPKDYTISLDVQYGNHDFQQCNETYSQNISIEKQDFEDLPCQMPMWIKQLKATPNTINLEYSPVYAAQQYSIRYKPTADIDGKWQTKSSTQNTINIDNLIPNTQYSVQVKCKCSGEINTKQESQWSLEHFFSAIDN